MRRAVAEWLQLGAAVICVFWIAGVLSWSLVTLGCALLEAVLR